MSSNSELPPVGSEEILSPQEIVVRELRLAESYMRALKNIHHDTIQKMAENGRRIWTLQQQLKGMINGSESNSG